MEQKSKQRRRSGQNKRKLSPDRLTLRPKETTRFTGMSVKATYDALKSGSMPSIRIGAKFLVPKRALIEWVNSCGRSGAANA